MSRRICDVQRDFALCSGLRSQIVWDSYGPDESEILLQKINALILDNNARDQGEIVQTRKTVFDNIWAQRKYTNGALLSSIIFVMVTKETNINMAARSSDFSCHPVFRTRKCLYADNSKNCCMIFVDETGRVYMNWKHFVETNILPKGTMVAPANGVYDFYGDDDDVMLEAHLTPAASMTNTILQTTDNVASVGGLLATVPMAATLVTSATIAAPVLTAAAIGGLAVAAYTAVRSGMQLTDRHNHAESLAITNANARREWLGVATGALGLGASGATRALRYTAGARQISLGTKIAVNTINISSLLISGSGLANSVYDAYIKLNNDESLDGNDLLHLAASLIVFTHSVNNLRIANKACRTRKGRNGRVRSLMSQQMRRTYERIFSEATRLRANAPSRINGIQTRGNAFDIVRTVNDISLNGVLENLHQNLPFNGSGIGGALGLVLQFLNGDLNVDLTQLITQLGAKFVDHTFNAASLREIMNAILKCLGPNIFQLLLNLTRTFLEWHVDHIDRYLCTFITTESVLYKMLMHCVKNYSNQSYEFIEDKTCEILFKIEHYYETLRPEDDGAKKVSCNHCPGYYIEYTLPSLNVSN